MMIMEGVENKRKLTPAMRNKWRGIFDRIIRKEAGYTDIKL